MNTEKKLPERKQIRLKEFDYRSVGAYFITICSEKRQPLLSSVHVLENGTVKTELTDYGKIAEEQMMALEVRYSCLTVEHYVIMPDHIHFICPSGRQIRRQRRRKQAPALRSWM